MARHFITGIDVGSSLIRIIVSEHASDHKLPHIVAAVKKTSRGLRHGYVANIDEVVESIEEAKQEAERICGSRLSRTLLGVGGITLSSHVSEGSIVVGRADEEVSEIDVGRAIDQSETNLKDATNKEILHVIPLQFKLDGKKVLGRAVGLKGSILEAKTIFITSLSQHIDDLTSAVTKAGFEIEEIIASPLAASFANLTKVQKMAGCVLANIGAQTVSIVVFEEGVPMSLAVFPIGSIDITHDIALGFSIPLDEAEEIKIGHRESGVQRKKLDEIIEARLSDIFELIENHLKKIARNKLLPAGIIITGGGSNTRLIGEFARSHLGLPAKVMSDFPVPTLLRDEKKGTVTKMISLDSGWSVSYGLCLMGKDTWQAEESIGIRIAKETKRNFMYWLRQLLP